MYPFHRQKKKYERKQMTTSTPNSITNSPSQSCNPTERTVDNKPMPHDYDLDDENSGKPKPYPTTLSPATLGMPQSGESMSEDEKGHQQYVNITN